MKKELWIVGGANGAGKTTWIREILPLHPETVYLSADQIAAEMKPQELELARVQAGRSGRRLAPLLQCRRDVSESRLGTVDARDILIPELFELFAQGAGKP